MRKIIVLFVAVLWAANIGANKRVDTSEDNLQYGRLHQWHAHTSYSYVEEIVVMENTVYALSNHSLMSVDKQTEEKEYYSRITGLSGSVIDHVGYNVATDAMLITYQNGQLDVIDSRGEIHNIPDLFLKQMNTSKEVNHIYMHNDKAYMSMRFGIVVLNMKKREIQDTYYIGENAGEVNVAAITIVGDSIYAAAAKGLYTAALSDNLMDYAAWTVQPLPQGNVVTNLCTYEDKLYVLKDSVLWSRSETGWRNCNVPFKIRKISMAGDELYIMPLDQNGITKAETDYTLILEEYGIFYDIQPDDDFYWVGTSNRGLCNMQTQRSYWPIGPINKIAYRMRFFDDRLYVVPGGRWAVHNRTIANLMYYENTNWINIPYYVINKGLDDLVYDLMNVAQDPRDANHCFVTTYGSGMLELHNTQESPLAQPAWQVTKIYTPDNSPLVSAVQTKPYEYTRTDGAMYDDKGYLWVLNTADAPGTKNVHVVNTYSDPMEWHSFNLMYNGSVVVLHTPGEILVDNRNPEWKWIPLCRYNTGLILLQDNGTPTNSRDDKVVYRTTWYDQNSNQIMPKEIHSVAQDMDGVIWVGTDAGLFLIPSNVDFTSSDRCERVIIRRNDGTDLGDYLLDNEKINSIVVDGANRKWIGTATSGVFLLSPDGLETIEHFTSDNSYLPSDNVLSIAIQPSNGDVFIGTSDGLVSYMSDATPPEEDFSNIYAFPNPIHPYYRGSVAIKGLMYETEVRILDGSGNLVKVIQGNGGEAVWDLTNASGSRVASGVYTAICNTIDGKAYGTVKILVMN